MIARLVGQDRRTWARPWRSAASVAVLAAVLASTAAADPIDDLVAQVSQANIAGHVAALSAAPRADAASWTAAADYIAATLAGYGYAVTRVPVGGSENVVVSRPGLATPARVVVVGAHFDSVPGSPGADDNASGVAGVLEIARVLAAASFPSTVELVAFGLEEQGLIGSDHHAAAAFAAARDVAAMLSLEMIGYTCFSPGCAVIFPDLLPCFDVQTPAVSAVGDWVGVVADAAHATLGQSFFDAATRYVPSLPVMWATVLGAGSCFPDTRRSDHAPFWDVGYPALLVTDTANFRNPNYHTPSDTLATLDLAFARGVTQAALATALAVASAPPGPCGNGALDTGEECDGGAGCVQCRCAASLGWRPTVPPTVACTRCGNGKLDAGEECDGGAQCTACACDMYHRPTVPATPDCAVDPASLRLDHFVTYKAKGTQGAAPFAGVGPIVFGEPFRTAKELVLKPRQLGLPAATGESEPRDPETHLASYAIKSAAGMAAFAQRSHVALRNPCYQSYGLPLEVELRKPDGVMVPSAASLGGPVDPPPPGAHEVDHFRCYKARFQPDYLPKLEKGTQLVIDDAFHAGPTRYDLKSVSRLCAPATKSIDDADPPVVLTGASKGSAAPVAPAVAGNADVALVCFKAKLAKSAVAQVAGGCGPLVPGDRGSVIVPAPAASAAVPAVHVGNQLGPLVVDALKVQEICVPSLAQGW